MMCVLLCANPKVHEWLDMPVALAYRQALQLSVLCPAASLEGNAGSAPHAYKLTTNLVEADELEPPPALHLMKRSAWVQAYCQRIAERHKSSPDWHKPLDALANAWTRLLALVGLRR
jgi:hypothetical protein